MKIINKNFAIVIFAIILNGCSSDWLEEKPPHLITAETLYTNLEGFETGLNALYAMVRVEREGLTSANDMVADVFMNGTDNLVTNHFSGFSTILERWEGTNNSHQKLFRELF